MRILALSHIFPPAVDGGSQIVYNLANSLKKNNQVLYISSNYSSTDSFTTHPLFKIFRKLGLPSGPFLDISKVLEAIKFQPNWILAGPLPTTVIFYTRLIQYFTNSKVLFIPCYHEADPAFTKNYFYKLLRHFHLWVFTKHEQKLLSPYCKNIIQHFPGIESSFLKIKKLPVRQAGLKSKTRKGRILFLGNLSAHKGIIPLMESMLYLPKHYSLTICGQKTLFLPEILKHKTAKVNIILKKFTSSMAKRLFANHDILVLPSTQESFGLVLAEGVSQGLPVVGINIPTTTEVFKKLKLTGLSKSQSPKDIAKAISVCSLDRKGQDLVKQECNWVNIAIWVNTYINTH